MAEEWRLLDTGLNDAFYNMALDEAIATARSKRLVPNTIRLYRWMPSAVSIGYFQSMEEEVNIEACDEMGIDYVRRRTGGGAVYHDTNGELTYSIVVDEDHRLISEDFLETYRKLCSGLVLGLRKLGIPAEFKPINDIVVHGKKISGNAQTRRWGTVLQHGTILVDADIRTMFKVLKVTKEKISDKLIKSVEERVTTINRELNRKIGFEEIAETLERGFQKALRSRLYEGELTGEEKALAEELYTKKYTKKEWNLDRPSAKYTRDLELIL